MNNQIWLGAALACMLWATSSWTAAWAQEQPSAPPQVQPGITNSSGTDAPQQDRSEFVLDGKGVKRSLSLLMGQYAFGNFEQTVNLGQAELTEPGRFVGSIDRLGMRLWVNITDRNHIYVMSSGISDKGMWCFYCNDEDYYVSLTKYLLTNKKSTVGEWHDTLVTGTAQQKSMLEAMPYIPNDAIIHYVLRRGR